MSEQQVITSSEKGQRQQPRFSSFFECDDVRKRALILGCAFILSAILGFAIDYCFCLVQGPLSTGSMHDPYRAWFFALCFFIPACFFTFRGQILCKPENLFLIILLSLTCFSAIAFDTYRVSWDCEWHYNFMLQYATPDLENELTEAESLSLVPDTKEWFNLADLQSYDAMLNASDANVSGQVITPNAAPYYRLASLPGSLVYLLMTALGVPFTIKFIGAHLVYAIIYSLVCYAGMKKLRSGKMLYAVIAMLPTAIFLAANYSYDYWVNAFMLYAGALLVGEFQHKDRPITAKTVVLMLGGFVLACAPKTVYFPLVLFCLLLPRQKFSSSKFRRWYRIAVVVVAVGLLFALFAPYLGGGFGTGDTRSGGAVNASEQVRYILSSPLAFLQTIVSFGMFYLSPINSRGYMTLWAYLGSPSAFIWILMVILMVGTTILDKSDCDGILCSAKNRIGAIVLALCAVGMVEAAFYVSFTAVGDTIVAGCQQRYIIPILFLFLVFLSSPRLGWPRKPKQRALFHGVVLGILCFCTLFTLWQLYIGMLF